MATIYQYARDPDYYMIPLYRDYDRPGCWYRTLCIYLNAGEIQWGKIASRDLIEDKEFYTPVGEINIDEVVIAAIRRAIDENP